MADGGEPPTGRVGICSLLAYSWIADCSGGGVLRRISLSIVSYFPLVPMVLVVRLGMISVSLRLSDGLVMKDFVSGTNGVLVLKSGFGRLTASTIMKRVAGLPRDRVVDSCYLAEKDDVGDYGGFFWSDFDLTAGGHGDEVERPWVRCGIGVFQIGLSLTVGVGGGVTSGKYGLGGSFCAGADADAWVCGVSVARESRLSGWAPNSKLGLMVDVCNVRIDVGCGGSLQCEIGQFVEAATAEGDVEGAMSHSTISLI